MLGIVDPAHVLILLNAASALSGYSIPIDPPPPVIELNTVEMEMLTCIDRKNKNDHSCEGSLGYYTDGNRIWIDRQAIDEDPTLESEDSYIVHELTHWLQKEHGWTGGGCPRIAARESEAYRIMNLYIEQYEHINHHVLMPETCGFSSDN